MSAGLSPSWCGLTAHDADNTLLGIYGQWLVHSFTLSDMKCGYRKSWTIGDAVELVMFGFGADRRARCDQQTIAQEWSTL